MKHWLFLRASSRPPDWECIADGVNLTSLTITSDDDNKKYTVPVNKTLGPETRLHLVKQWPHGQTLTQFDKDVTSLAIVKHKNGATITQSFIPEVMRDDYNLSLIHI